MNNFAYQIVGTSIFLVIDNTSYDINEAHPNYKEIRKAIQTADFDAVFDLVDMPQVISTYSHGRIHIDKGAVYYDQHPLHGYDIDRLLDLMAEGFNVDSLCAFIERKMKNPSATSIRDMYQFLEIAKCSFTPDGMIIAYKGVKEDYTDCHTGKIDNSVGAQIPRMERWQVDDNNQNACSHGYHVGSEEFAKGYGPRTMLVLVDPADVVSVPVDAERQKMRITYYKPVGEIGRDVVTPLVEDFNNADEEYDDDDYDEDDWENEGGAW